MTNPPTCFSASVEKAASSSSSFPDVQDQKIEAEAVRCGQYIVGLALGDVAACGIDQDADGIGGRQSLVQNFQPLRSELEAERGDAR